MIEKKPRNNRFRITRIARFSRARSALAWFLRNLEARRGDKILLPAYIGWSPREGSGVFDPIRELGLVPVFYHMDNDLRVDHDDFHRKATEIGARFSLIIHYFGLVDDHYEGMASILRNKGVIIIEDSAHALLTDLVGSGCGRLGDASIYSLHKILPVESGGILSVRDDSPIKNILENYADECECTALPWEYNLEEIARLRVRNYKYLMDKIQSLKNWMTPLRPYLKSAEIPQTFPVRVISGSRDDLYNRMNDLGFGVVSLYHTLIDEIDRTEFKTEYGISKNILNLPIHQDVDLVSLDAMAASLLAIFKEQGQ